MFHRNELAAMGVPDRRSAVEGRSAKHLYEDIFDEDRWSTIHELVFRAPDDGRTYKVYYHRPATEMQDVDPWNDEIEFEATEVERVEVTTKEWREVGKKPMPSLAGLLKLIDEFVIESNDIGGIDANDLADRARAKGYALPGG
jgi:hypothetical protein